MNKQRYKKHEGEEYSLSGEYIQDCEKCGKENRVFTQDDSGRPEYYTDIHTFCSCGNRIMWELPVN